MSVQASYLFLNSLVSHLVGLQPYSLYWGSVSGPWGQPILLVRRRNQPSCEVPMFGRGRGDLRVLLGSDLSVSRLGIPLMPEGPGYASGILPFLLGLRNIGVFQQWSVGNGSLLAYGTPKSRRHFSSGCSSAEVHWHAGLSDRGGMACGTLRSRRPFSFGQPEAHFPWPGRELASRSGINACLEYII
jgi:hypothetical protein